LRLRTFGGLYIEELPKGLGGTAGQRRPLALLLLLAEAGEQGVSRDKLAAFLWGESDRERSRSALRQLVYSIRRDLENPAVILGVADLRLNAAVLPSDLADFDRAYRERDFESLVALYTGPLADGFYLNGAPEFERWLHAAQQQRTQQFAEAIRSMAHDADRRGDRHAVVACWRRLAAADPLSTEVSLHYVQALADVGDPTSALQHARAHELRLREELGVAPDAALLQLTERLRTPPRARDAIVPRGPSYSPTVGLPAVEEERESATPGSSTEAIEPVATTTADAMRPVAGRQNWSSTRVLAAVLLFIALIGGIAAATLARLRSQRQPDPRLLAIVPFQTVDSGLVLWNAGIADLLAHTLDGRDGLQAVPPSVSAREWSGHSDAVSARELAERTGAGTVVYGFVVRAGVDSVKVMTSILHMPANQTVTVEHRESLAHVDRLVDSITVAVAQQALRWR
jgi:DNA-binding SARP family transcriptional activator